MFNYAVVQPPGKNFALGLSTADLGAPDYKKALEQHERYCQALEQCGITLIRLQADLDYPDSTFVEDAAVLTDQCAILCRPGAISRRGEVDRIQQALTSRFSTCYAIMPPGTLDGGDICEVGGHYFIGISKRTNEEGARQLAVILELEGYSSSFVDIRKLADILHLKSGIAALGDGRLVLIEALAGMEVFQGYEIILVEPDENYAANCVRVNEHVLLAAGFPKLLSTVQALGYPTITLEMSEFQKMDGGLSCLSLRF